MLINLWATPRTGSTWFSQHLKSQYPGSQLLREMFVQSILARYYFIDQNGIVRNSEYYKPGCHFTEYYLDNGLIKTKIVHGPRTLSDRNELEYLLDIVERFDSSSNTYIFHHHVTMPLEIIERLKRKADRNIYLHRKNKREQLASFAIAVASKQWIATDKSHVVNDQVSDIPIKLLKEFIKLIEKWDSLEKEEIIAYEDLEFVEKPGLPYKQNYDHSSRLSDFMISEIDKLVTEYELKNSSYK